MYIYLQGFLLFLCENKINKKMNRINKLVSTLLAGLSDRNILSDYVSLLGGPSGHPFCYHFGI